MSPANDDIISMDSVHTAPREKRVRVHRVQPGSDRENRPPRPSPAGPGGWKPFISGRFQAQPGYISSDPAPPGMPGHVGIVDFDGQGISAGMNNVNRFFKACGSHATLRKYIGEEL